MKANKTMHFDISERKVLLRVLDIVAVLSLLYLVNLIFKFDYFQITSKNWLWTIVLIIYLTVFATIFELYNLQKASKIEVVVKNVILTSSLTVLVYLLTPFYTPMLPNNRLQIVYFFLSINAALLIWRFAYITLISSPRFYKRILLIANADEMQAMVDCLQKSDPNYRVLGFINTQQIDLEVKLNPEIEYLQLSNISEAIERLKISEIVVGAPMTKGITEEINNELIKLLEVGLPIREYSQVYEELTHRIPVHRVENHFYRYFPFSRSNKNQLYLLFSRILDLIFSLVGMVFGIIIIPFIFLFNLIWNPGPLFYNQERMGRNGKSFSIYKFRSMIVHAEESGPRYAELKDARITSFGRFLRHSRLDEVPQFINVIKGEMSVIGPRPERPEFVKNLIQEIPFYEVRHYVKPGVTGWAQVNAKYASSHDDSLEKLQYDLYYIKHRSFSLDLVILVKTLSTIIFFRGQ